MSQHTPHGNFISNTARGAVRLAHGVADQILPPAVDSVFHGVARGLLDWAGAPTQPCYNQSYTPPGQPCYNQSYSPPGQPCYNQSYAPPGQSCYNQSYSPPGQPTTSPSLPGKPWKGNNSGNTMNGNDNVQASGNDNSGTSKWTIGKR